ncbi:MAG: DUF805 domain-containing protein [Prolixibacteraceae bacterium]
MNQLMRYFLKVLKNYSDFNGRARRIEFWAYTLVIGFLSVLLFAIEFLANTATVSWPVYTLSSLLGLLFIIPFVAVSIRRLHDTGREAWWLLLLFVPALGALILFFIFLEDSSPSYNQYGEYPKFNYDYKYKEQG